MNPLLLPPPLGIADCTVSLAVRHLRAMGRLVHALYRLSRSSAYCSAVESLLPPVARFDPGHDAVMMGYDFHLSPAGPRLIEVNTNAGGGWLAYRAQHPTLHDEAEWPASRRWRERLRQMFAQELMLCRDLSARSLRRVIILEEEAEQQFLYPEMVAFIHLLQQWGYAAAIAAPAELESSAAGVWYRGERVALIYNRHCDFYLESPALVGVREAYLAGSLCLSPNPRAYGLLADKRRLPLWDAACLREMAGIAPPLAEELAAMVPESAIMKAEAVERLWQTRKRWIFKPVNQFGSRGVVLGDSISRSRFNALPMEQTLVQRVVPPSRTVCGEKEYKTDFRLFVYQNRLLGVGARVYRGQVTNFREAGNGFARLRLVRS